MNHFIPPMRIVPLFIAGLLVFALAGCDSGTGDTIILNNIRAEFEFEFQGDELTTGELQDLASNGSANITSQLSSLGFTLEEILSAEVIEASIELVVPTFVGSGIDLRAFNEVILQLDSGGTVREVASRTGFTSEEPADLNVIRNRDISGILRGGSFVAILQVEPASLEPDELYSLEVVLILSVEVEGV